MSAATEAIKAEIAVKQGEIEALETALRVLDGTGSVPPRARRKVSADDVELVKMALSGVNDHVGVTRKYLAEQTGISDGKVAGVLAELVRRQEAKQTNAPQTKFTRWALVAEASPNGVAAHAG
jgi:hypothetical protein